MTVFEREHAPLAERRTGRFMKGGSIHTATRPREAIRSLRFFAAALLSCTLGMVDAIAQSSVLPGTPWAQYCGSASRVAVTDSSIPSIDAPAWVRGHDQFGNPISFIGQAGVVVSDALVIATGGISPPGEPANQYRLFAFRRGNGTVAWAAPILYRTAYGSHSTPAIDRFNRTAIASADRYVYAFNLDTGYPVWQTQLNREVVNASALVTGNELGAADRVFITDYGPLSLDSRLYCINADPWSPSNPFQPGEIVWSVPIGGCSGNTVAYRNGVVYVANTGDFIFGSPGQIMAFPANALTAPAPLWVFENVQPDGFFGGVCVADSPTESLPAVFACSYSFYGGLWSANLVKLNAQTGALLWSTPCNRTNSVPVPLPDGRVAVSAGVVGYGSAPNVQFFMDQGTSATALWDTNGRIVVGGRNQQPIVSIAGGQVRLMVGATPTAPGSNPNGACTDLYILDLSRFPADTGFVLDHFHGAGSSPALVNGNIYTLGDSGLHAFGAPPILADVNEDGLVTIEDLYWWDQVRGRRDVDLDGVVTGNDKRKLESWLRATERTELSARW